MSPAPSSPAGGALPTRVRVGYGLGSVATGSFGTVPGLMLLPYLTDVLGVSALAAGLVVFAPKAWDVVLNPVAGRVTDRTVDPRGPRRPWLLRAGIALAATFALVFAGPALGSPAADATWVLVAFLACATAYAFFQVPYVAMPAELTGSYDERTRLMTWRVAVLALAIMVSGATAPAVVEAVGGRDGYRLMGLLVAALLLVGVLGAYAGTAGAPRSPAPAGVGSLREQLRVVAASADFRRLLTTFVVQALAVGAMLAGVAYVARWVLGSPTAATLLFVCFVGPALVLTPAWSALGARVGKRRGYVVASLVLAAGALLLLGAAVWPTPAVYAATALVGAGYAGVQVFPLAMLPDVAAVDAARTGETRTGVFTGVWTAGETLGLALGPAVFAGVLALGGYVSAAEAEPERCVAMGGDTACSVVQPDSALTAIVLGFSLLPAVLVLLSLLPLRGYHLDARAVAGATGPPRRAGRDREGDLMGDDVLAQLHALRADDVPVGGGRTLAYVYDSGDAEVERVGREAVAALSGANGLDPTAFPSLLAMENDLVGLTCDLLDAPAGVVGTVTSGGTESCLLAVQAARDARPDVDRPRLVAPTTVHPAFHKAAHYFGLELVLVDVGPDFRADPEALVAAVAERPADTVLAVVSAPSYAHGVVDPVAEVGAALPGGVRLHVDACIGGWVLPYAARLGRAVRPWTFAVDRVTSISVDLHKYAYAPKGTSVLLHRDAGLRRPAYFSSARWPGYTMLNSTMQSTRSGGPLAGAWAVTRQLGDAGYLRLTERLLAAVDRLAAGVGETEGLHLLAAPDASLLALGTGPDLDVFTLAELLAAAGWLVQPQLSSGDAPPSLHLSPSAATDADAFLADLRTAVAEARRRGPVAVDPGVAEVVRGLEPAGLDDATLDVLLAAAGLDPGAGGLPQPTAEVNALLDLAAPGVREAVLVAVLDRMQRPARR